MEWLQSIGILVGATVGVLVVFIISTIVWVKNHSKGKIYLYLVESNDDVNRYMVDITDESKAVLRRQEYDVVPGDCQFRTLWPSGVPKFLQERVASQMHIRNVGPPINPRKGGGQKDITAKSRYALSDQRMLEMMWKDVRRDLGIGGGGTTSLKSWSTWVTIITLAGVLGLGVFMYLLYVKVSALGV